MATTTRIKTMKQIATSRTIRGFRSCNSIVGTWSDFAHDQARIATDRAQVLANEIRRQWLNIATRSHHN